MHFDENATENERSAFASQREREFIEVYEPEIHEEFAYIFAATSYRDFQRYGLPRRGGSWKQPIVWKIAVDLVHDAIRHGEAEAEEYAAFAD